MDSPVVVKMIKDVLSAFKKYYNQSCSYNPADW